jgi:glycosyltransferase involved in cell wall biosynthesis
MPHRNAGSETVLHLILKRLAASGHEVCCWITDIPSAPRVSTFEGVEIRNIRNISVALRDVMKWRPDVAISHHQHAALMIRTLRSTPTVYLTHNDMWVNKVPLAAGPDFVIHNSRWVSRSLAKQYGQPKKSMVLHPPLDCERHLVGETGDAVTMVNINADKGAHVFYEMAKRMPETQFLGVLGGHGKQVTQFARLYPNVELVRHAPDLRVVMMPSVYESYGLVPAEAGVSGIPSVTAPTPGLIESRGQAGIHVDRNDLDRWEKVLARLLTNEFDWQLASEASHKRSRWLCSESDAMLDRVVKEIESL